MGRGRAKAKQTKVARELKYSTGTLDPDRLKAELAADPFARATSRSADGADDVEFESDEDETEDDDEA